MTGLLGEERGQALVEVVAGLPAMLAIGLVMLQLLAVGYSAVLAGVAAEAGALALAGGDDAGAAVKRSLPGWSEARARVEVSGGTVRVLLRPPAPLALVARKLEVDADATVELP
ncbi:MAG TPA: hypothetical protein VHF88_05845 [Thermoleophilaceae bacterium]|nr:hypothetical protein [Thermoleophilaceae bacterium]